MKQLYVCEDSIMGIYSAIYDAWKESRVEGDNGIRLIGQFEGELFCEYHIVEETTHKAMAVEAMMKKHIGLDAYWDIYHALMSPAPERADAVLGVMQTARTLQDPRKVMQFLSHPKVERVFELSRMVANEAHFFVEFLRFRELENGILFSEITPKSQVLTCIADHFANRFPLENWMIYDKTHQTYLVHESRKHWIQVLGEDLNLEAINHVSRAEQEYASLWKAFCRTIAIEERKNLKLQRNNLPLHFRRDMLEFQAGSR